MLTIIMAGGVGERFWPQSQVKRPKQLLNLTGKGSMIKLTIERLQNLSKPEEIFIITNVNQADSIRREVPAVPAENIIAEPEKRNTAPCIGVACRFIQTRFGNQPVLVLPADHVIEDIPLFERAVRVGEAYVSEYDVLLTFGIKPTRPETGYGYIRTGPRLNSGGEVEIYRSEGFLEKPSIEDARKFYSDDKYVWNSGMFMWRVEVILDAINRFLPDLGGAVSELKEGTIELESVLKSIYPNITAESIDYGIMEKADNVVILKGTFFWNDVGSWESIRDLFPPDDQDNVLVGDHVVIDGTGNTVYSTDKMIGMIGVDDIVVVDGGNALLVCKRERAQEVRKVVDWLKKNGRADLF